MLFNWHKVSEKKANSDLNFLFLQRNSSLPMEELTTLQRHQHLNWKSITFALRFEFMSKRWLEMFLFGLAHADIRVG